MDQTVSDCIGLKRSEAKRSEVKETTFCRMVSASCLQFSSSHCLRNRFDGSLAESGCLVLPIRLSRLPAVGSQKFKAHNSKGRFSIPESWLILSPKCPFITQSSRVRAPFVILTLKKTLTVLSRMPAGMSEILRRKRLAVRRPSRICAHALSAGAVPVVKIQAIGHPESRNSGASLRLGGKSPHLEDENRLVAKPQILGSLLCESGAESLVCSDFTRPGVPSARARSRYA